MTRETITRPDESDTTTTTVRPPATPGPGTRGHANAAREQARAHDPALSVHPLVAAAVVAIVGLVALAWNPLGTDSEPADAVVSNVLDVDTLQQEKEALTASASTRAVPLANDVATVDLAREKVIMRTPRPIPPTNGVAAADLAGEKLAIVTRRSASVPGNVAEAATLAAERAARTARAHTPVAPLLTAADEKRLLVTRGH